MIQRRFTFIISHFQCCRLSLVQRNRYYGKLKFVQRNRYKRENATKEIAGLIEAAVHLFQASFFAFLLRRCPISALVFFSFADLADSKSFLLLPSLSSEASGVVLQLSFLG